MRKIVSFFLACSLLLSITFISECQKVNALVFNYPQVEGIFLSAWDNFEESADIKECNVNVSDFNQMCDKIFDRNPERFYVMVDYCKYDSNDIITTVYFEYKWSEEESREKIEIFNEKCQKILNLMPDGLDDVQKLLFLHDYIAENTVYDLREFNGISTQGDKYIRSAYGCIVNELAVCEGISEAFLYFCKRLSIKAYAVKSTAMHHEWNMVKLGDNYYHIDITQDAPVYNLGVNGFHQAPGDITHKFFLKSDEEIKNSELGNSVHYSWNAPHEATDSETFKDAFWNDSQGEINYHEGWFYYVTGSNLFRYNYFTHDLEKLYTLQPGVWSSTSGKTYLWHTKYAKSVVDFNNDLVYITSDNVVYSYNMSNGSMCVIYSRNGKGFIYSVHLKSTGFKISVRDYDKKGNAFYDDYTISPASEKYINRVMGDANSDNQVNISDLLSIKKYLANGDSENFDANNADVRLDSQINAKDALALKRILVNKSK